MSPNTLHAQPQDVTWDSQGRAEFNGRSASLEVPASPALRLGTKDFTVALWLRLDPILVDSPGDLLTLFDPATRTGFNLTVQHQSGACGSMANTRNLFFGLDAGTEPRWTDCGRLGNELEVMGLALFNGKLYGGTLPSGHVHALEAGCATCGCMGARCATAK